MSPEIARSMFREAGIEELYYILPLDNIASIKLEGILPLNEVKRRGIPSASFALEGPQ